MDDILKNIDLTPKNDVIFKILFGDEKNSRFLVHLLNALLRPQDPIVSVMIKSSEITEGDVKNWWVRLDILAETSNKTLINIELQKANMHNFIERATYYESRVFSKQHVEKQHYENLKKTVFIAILNFYLFHDERYWHKHVWKDDETNEPVAEDLQEMHFFELPKIRKKYDMKHDMLWFWLKFIDNPNDEELKNMYVVEKICGDVRGAYDNCIADEHTQELLRMRYKAEMDKLSEIAACEKEAAEKATLIERAKAEKREAKIRAQAEEEKAKLAKKVEKAEQEKAKLEKKAEEEKIEIKRNTARSLKSILPLEQVAQISGLSVEEVMRL